MLDGESNPCPLVRTTYLGVLAAANQLARSLSRQDDDNDDHDGTLHVGAIVERYMLDALAGKQSSNVLVFIYSMYKFLFVYIYFYLFIFMLYKFLFIVHRYCLIGFKCLSSII